MGQFLDRVAARTVPPLTWGTTADFVSVDDYVIDDEKAAFEARRLRERRHLAAFMGDCGSPACDVCQKGQLV